MIRIPPRENLSYKIATTVVDCACPVCGITHRKRLELSYQDSHSTPEKAGYYVIACDEIKCIKYRGQEKKEGE